MLYAVHFHGINSIEIRIENYDYLQQYYEIKKCLSIVYIFIVVDTTVAANNKWGYLNFTTLS